MFRIAIQTKELIASNVESALDSATDPAKMLARLQSEIEEALIGLHGDIGRADRKKDRLANAISLSRAQEGDWVDKAKIAMDHGREDLARQALMAREDCRTRIAEDEREIARLAADIAEMRDAESKLEAKREAVRQRHADQLAARGRATGPSSDSRTERRLDHIETLEMRTAFATSDESAAASHAGVEREFQEMQRASKVEQELAALRENAGKKAKKPAKRS